MRSVLPVRLLAIGQVLFTIAYFSYMLYISFSWGFTPRMVQILVTDSIYLILIISAAGLLFLKTWGWWVTVILYGKLLMSKLIGTGTEWFLLLSGTIAEKWRWDIFFADLFIILLYTVILACFFLRRIRRIFNVHEAGKKMAFLVTIGIILLYSIYFVTAFWLIVQLG
ncbi:hypothetical protein [Alteribacter keqinensis]|uniref:Uncharacterized protein n=1 Tax=Alteribacter keqinensis TaxID=2483800 RepID=A0A3M7TUC0_9BACI|nr:hypothetical protein [Alteribacter keqinensis]RNA69246.1 hypothetical protein EBO34_04675 [Alteribacter keqinensis]